MQSLEACKGGWTAQSQDMPCEVQDESVVVEDEADSKSRKVLQSLPKLNQLLDGADLEQLEQRVTEMDKRFKQQRQKHETPAAGSLCAMAEATSWQGPTVGKDPAAAADLQMDSQPSGRQREIPDLENETKTSNGTMRGDGHAAQSGGCDMCPLAQALQESQVRVAPLGDAAAAWQQELALVCGGWADACAPPSHSETVSFCS
jgi:hypothetical protein